MSESNQDQERRDGTSGRIDHLLKERQQLLVLYSRVAGLEPYHPKDTPVGSVLREFLQVLVDYVAATHFELYNRIEEGKERRRAVLQVARRAHPRLTDITHQAVAFNDKYEATDGQELVDSLSRDLSRLGEQWASRFELEDRLFQAFLAR